MKRYALLGLCGVTTVILLLMGILGTIQVIQNTRKYGFTYEVVTITNGDETKTTMSVWVNIAFLIFLMLNLSLLVLLFSDYWEVSKWEKH